jgi:WD40 repeat protein
VLPRDEAVTGLRNGDLVIWSLRTGQPSRQLLSGSGRHAHAREVKAVARSEDSKYLVSASADGTLKVWDVETERHINTLNGHNDEVRKTFSDACFTHQQPMRLNSSNNWLELK